MGGGCHHVQGWKSNGLRCAVVLSRGARSRFLPCCFDIFKNLQGKLAEEDGLEDVEVYVFLLCIGCCRYMGLCGVRQGLSSPSSRTLKQCRYGGDSFFVVL